MTQAGYFKWEAIVGMRLVQDKSRTGIKYSIVAPRMITRAAPELAACMKALGEACEPLFKRTGINTPPSDITEQEQGARRAEAQAAEEKQETVTAAASAEADTEAARQAGVMADSGAEELFDRE